LGVRPEDVRPLDASNSLSLGLEVTMVDLLGCETINRYVTPEGYEETTMLKGRIAQSAEVTSIVVMLIGVFALCKPWSIKIHFQGLHFLV
jgi:hypothetical protein